jgi:hypothetical protein
MGTMSKKLMVLAVVASVATAAPSLGAQNFRGRAYVTIQPPPERVEVFGRPPGPRYIWSKGYYVQQRGRWVWLPGRWIMPPPGRRVWVPGYWARDRSGWYWREGFWR